MFDDCGQARSIAEEAKTGNWIGRACLKLLNGQMEAGDGQDVLMRVFVAPFLRRRGPGGSVQGDLMAACL